MFSRGAKGGDVNNVLENLAMQEAGGASVH